MEGGHIDDEAVANLIAFKALGYCRGGLPTGDIASSPTAVIHSRTRHATTKPLTTYGSARANFSATEALSAWKSRTPVSRGSVKAPARTSTTVAYHEV